MIMRSDTAEGVASWTPPCLVYTASKKFKVLMNYAEYYYCILSCGNTFKAKGVVARPRCAYGVGAKLLQGMTQGSSPSPSGHLHLKIAAASRDFKTTTSTSRSASHPHRRVFRLPGPA